MHDNDGVGECQRLGLVVGDVDHREVELAMQRLQLGAQLPLQLGIDDGERLIEQHGRDVGTHQAAAERDLLLGVGGEARRLAVQVRREVEQVGDLPDPRIDFGPGDAAVLQRERQVLTHRHGVVDDRELEHLRDVALLRGQRRDVTAVEQNLSARRRHDAGNQIEQRGLAAAGRPEQRIGSALPPGHGDRLQRKGFQRRVIAVVGLGEIDEVNAGHQASPSLRETCCG
jgi:hypothetical protein